MNLDSAVTRYVMGVFVLGLRLWHNVALPNPLRNQISGNSHTHSKGGSPLPQPASGLLLIFAVVQVA